MITLKEFFETAEYRITEGSPFGWNCYGSHAYALSAWNGIHDEGGWSLNVVFDTQNQTVFEVDVCDYTNDRAYRLVNPNYKEDYEVESKRHGELGKQAWDGVNYVDLDSDEDFLEKASAIVLGQDYDTRVQVPIDLPQDEMFRLMTLAHERDITLNQLVEEVLWTAINKYRAADKELAE